jgi:probable H4MPT-linked C1 transfer pathway protein
MSGPEDSVVLGLDIGGANLKAADSEGRASSVPFPLWAQPERLPEALAGLLARFPRPGRVAVTMTGELCDCYESKRLGVRAILDSVQQSCSALPADRIQVWMLDGQFHPLEQAYAQPPNVAAGNWLALATFVCRHASGSALLVDVGSTTTDIIPLRPAGGEEGTTRPVPRGWSDPERLQSGELVYTGWSRTPVCALARGPVMAEFFATTRDVYLLLEACPEDPACRDTADRRPATREQAHARLARMLGGDGETIPPSETLALARQVQETQHLLLLDAFARVGATFSHWPTTWILAGSGEFLVRAALERWRVREGITEPICLVSLSEQLGPDLSRAACAYACAILFSGNRLVSGEWSRGTGGRFGAHASARATPPTTHHAPRTTHQTVVVKVGGSLYDLPDLGSRLCSWLSDCGLRIADCGLEDKTRDARGTRAETDKGGSGCLSSNPQSAIRNPQSNLVLVPGGGATADVIRTFDRNHHLGEARAHWLALRAVALNAHFLADLLGGQGVVVGSSLQEECQAAWSQGKVPLVDAHAFIQADQGRPGCLPCCWEATTDSVAARVAIVMRARELILLKSVTIPEGMSWREASLQGWVDQVFPEVIEQAQSTLCVRVCNFREWPSPGA